MFFSSFLVLALPQLSSGRGVSFWRFFFNPTRAPTGMSAPATYRIMVCCRPRGSDLRCHCSAVLFFFSIGRNAAGLLPSNATQPRPLESVAGPQSGELATGFWPPTSPQKLPPLSLSARCSFFFLFRPPVGGAFPPSLLRPLQRADLPALTSPTPFSEPPFARIRFRQRPPSALRKGILWAFPFFPFYLSVPGFSA